MDLKDVGRRVKERRKRLGWSQQELAEKVGYADKGLISRIESGSLNVSMDKMIKLASALGVNVADLVATEPDRTLPPGGFHGGNTRPDVIPVIEMVKELDADDVARVKAYIQALRSVKTWQRLNGTANAGASESALMGQLDRSRAPLLDEEDAKMLSAVQERAAGSPSSALSERRGDGISKK